ncbi:MAG: hypothetical protein HIU81_10445 [Acidobacteria bacterium]|nr:hypothetical protein [Acidobacteriota bacterium]
MAVSKIGSNNSAEQEPLTPGVPTPWPDQVPATADAAVDAILAPLVDLPNAPVASHQEVFSQMYDALNRDLNAEPAHSPAKPGGNP